MFYKLLCLVLLATPTISVGDSIALDERKIPAVLNIINTIIIQSTNNSKTSLDRISNYVDTNGISEVPSVVDYQNVPIVGVDESNLDTINAIIATYTLLEVDTASKLQAVINEILGTPPKI